MAVRWDPSRFKRGLNRKLERQLDIAAIGFQGDLTAHFTKGNVTGRTPSAPGEIPAVVTGREKGSMMVEKPGPLRRRVGSALKPQGGQQHSYPLLQEFGTSNMEPRPWLRPGLDRYTPTIKTVMGAR